MRVHRLFLALALFAASLHAQDWDALHKGNEEFQSGAIDFTMLDDLRDRLRPGQHPQVTILACADSRVPPEIVFAQTLGQVFVVRVAGNVADSFGLASLKYAASKEWTGTVIVLGHEDCGAVVEARKEKLPTDDDLRALVRRIRAGIRGTSSLEEAIKANARASAKYVSEKAGVKAVAAYYDMTNGEVTLLRP